MARKVFLSFLGVSPYTICNYVHEEQTKITHFVQIATLSMFCKNWEKEDAVYLFLTDTAKRKNWIEENENKYTGLETEIKNLQLKPVVQPIDIPENSIMNTNKENAISSKDIEQEIWTTFSIVFGVLQKDDEVIFDITHSLRYMPMLVTILLDYARFTKNIKILGIYYGAFEVLGFGKQIEVNYPNVVDRKAPIVDLSAFPLLQKWANAASDFVNLGSAKKIVELTKQDIKPLLKEAQGKDPVLKEFSNFAKNLEDLTGLLNTNRGKEILEGKVFENLRKSLSAAKGSQTITPLKPLFEIIENKIEYFISDNVSNGFAAVKWCIEHKWIQQGLTMLQENTITFLCDIWKNKYKLSFVDVNSRNLLNAAINILSKNIARGKWNEIAHENEAIMYQLLDESIIKKVFPIYESLTACRNDINHGGFTQNTPPDKFLKKLEDCYAEILEIVYFYTNINIYLNLKPNQ